MFSGMVLSSTFDYPLRNVVPASLEVGTASTPRSRVTADRRPTTPGPESASTTAINAAALVLLFGTLSSTTRVSELV